jgi:formylglycine-generating enzyme required for sulfatase activity
MSFRTWAAVCAAVANLGAPLHMALTQVSDAEFVLIEPGTFQMGDSDNGPIHQVTLTKPFWIQKTEVTQRQWAAVMRSKPSHFQQCGASCPVERVSYADVQEFIAKLNARSKKKYRLPTEAEWEYAARAGTTADYGTPGPVTRGGWTYDNSEYTTHPVGKLRPNAWGLYDMEGNVWEWVNDWKAPYPSDPTTDPAGPVSGDRRVLRGGSWVDDARAACSATRFSDFPDQAHRSYGFRLARTP